MKVEILVIIFLYKNTTKENKMRVVKAKLIKRCTDDSIVEMNDNVPLGRTYSVDLDTICKFEMINTEKKVRKKRQVIHDILGGWLPLEMLEIRKEDIEKMKRVKMEKGPFKGKVIEFETEGSEKMVKCIICKTQFEVTFFRKDPDPNDATLCPSCGSRGGFEFVEEKNERI